MKLLLNNFICFKVKNKILVNKEHLYSILEYISNNKLSVIKIEKKEKTLESLFMEVVK